MSQHYSNTAVRLCELPATSNTIRGVTFENCQIIGPAVVFLVNSTLAESSIEGQLSDVIWELADERDKIIGAIALDDCRILKCQLRDIGFAVTRSRVPDFIAGMS